MANQNLLLGSGEKLMTKIPHKFPPVDKAHPYDYQEVKNWLKPGLNQLIGNFRSLPEEACPEGHVVSKLTLHPTYLAKSYYPNALLRGFGFTDIGSTPVRLRPKKKRTNLDDDDPMLTSCLYVAGEINAFMAWYDHLDADDFKDNVIEDIRKIENLDEFNSNEKIRSISDKPNQKYEIVLHTPNNHINVIEAFEHYTEIFDGELSIDFDRMMFTGGLTFVPLIGEKAAAEYASAFTFLRTVRVLPEISVNKPVVIRNTQPAGSLTLPEQDAINPGINVAVFDGGIGTNDVERWCEETTYGSGNSSHDLLSHGAEVTSTILFGPVEDEQESLPVPFCNIDHYRVLDPHVDNYDPDLFEVLKRILDALNSKNYDFINLSLGPRIPIEDDDVHVWTSMLDDRFSKSDALLTVAVGNDGELAGQNRVQPPSDMVNALGVGATDKSDDDWARAGYSCVGPGRSPGLIKPDGVAFGGCNDEKFRVYSPFSGEIIETGGTSYAAPLALRSAIGISTAPSENISPLSVKTLLIHYANAKNLPQEEVGWGKFPHDIDNIFFTADNEATIIYRSTLGPSQKYNVPVPLPDIEMKGQVTLKATFCFQSEIDPEHPIHYTRSGLKVVFRPKGLNADASPFFTQSKMYETEQDARQDAHKWETVLRNQRKFNTKTLDNPCFEIIYHAREQGHAANSKDLKPLPFVLVITITANNTPELYNSVRQKYRTLQPIEVRQDIKIKL